MECRTIAAALATFKDSAWPFIGIATVLIFISKSGNPLASFPKIQTAGFLPLVFMKFASKDSFPSPAKA
jgi:hypothetical protein